MAEALEQVKVSSDEPAETVSEVSKTNKKRKHVGEVEAVPNDRPRRQARPVVPYGSQASETKLRVKPPVNIVQGKGLALGQIPSVARAIDKHKTSDETLKNIHRLFYGRAGTKNDIKSHLRAFSGLNAESPVDATVIKEKLERLKMTALKNMCAFFNIKVSGDKSSIIERLIEFIKEPFDTLNKRDLKLHKDKIKQLELNQKARDIFFTEQRSILKSKEENKSATKAQIDKQLLNAWNDMSEKDKEPFFARAKDAKNKKTPTVKKSETPKKLSETIDNDDEDDEEDKKPKKRTRVTKKGSTKVVKSKFKSPETIESDDDKPEEDPEDDDIKEELDDDSEEKEPDETKQKSSKEDDNNKSESEELSDVPDESDGEKEVEPPRKKTKKNVDKN
ncbi:protein DEK isoform X1 [Gigaspora margarita]|uniref:Protein DEK isoform X1 n=1 Tax=Gigaspora margarita TaxID=4874 RepID=A0A8H3X2P2_GIGMA|nr:protein DEK isoform X1 [Gigaspora margarita]